MSRKQKAPKPHCWGAAGPIYHPTPPPLGEPVWDRVCVDCGATLRSPLLSGWQEVIPPRYGRACNKEWRVKA